MEGLWKWEVAGSRNGEWKEEIVRLRIERNGGNMEHGGGLRFAVAAASINKENIAYLEALNF